VFARPKPWPADNTPGRTSAGVLSAIRNIDWIVVMSGVQNICKRVIDVEVAADESVTAMLP
jgi:hypothetical protein